MHEGRFTKLRASKQERGKEGPLLGALTHSIETQMFALTGSSSCMPLPSSGVGLPFSHPEKLKSGGNRGTRHGGSPNLETVAAGDKVHPPTTHERLQHLFYYRPKVNSSSQLPAWQEPVKIRDISTYARR
jgi:hypothetical protein